MATKTDICNLALMEIGETAVTEAQITADTEARAKKINDAYDQVLDEVLAEGPEKGWKFAKSAYYGIDRDSVTITSIANSSTSGDITVTGTHALIVGDMVQLTGDTGYDDTYDVNAISTTTTFDVTATFSATGTGTAYWTSEEYSYRYAIPSSCIGVVSVNAGGVELTDWIQRGIWILTNLEDSEVDIHYVKQVTTTTLFPAYFVKAFYFALAANLAFSISGNKMVSERVKNYYLTVILPKAVALDEKRKYVKEEDASWVECGRTSTTIV